MAPVIIADAVPELGLLREDIFAPDPVAGAGRRRNRCPERRRPMPLCVGSLDLWPGGAGAPLSPPRVRAGSVTINDLIVPTADPRLPFGGQGVSGFGVTRGAEGLLEMTAIKAVTIRTGRFPPSLRAGWFQPIPR